MTPPALRWLRGRGRRSLDGDGLRVDGEARIFQAEPLEPLHDRARDEQVPEPLLVGGDDIPWGGPRARVLQGVLVGLHVLAPEPPFLDVRQAELPLLGWVAQPVFQPSPLLGLVYVKEELQDDRAVFVQEPLKVLDVVVAAQALLFRDEPVDPAMSTSS